LLRGEQKKGRALAFNGKRGLGLDLLGRRPPLLQVREAKALVQEEADVGGNGPMLFDDAFCQPVRRALALTQIAAHRPRLATAFVIAPARLEGCRYDWVFDGEEQASARRQGRSHLPQQTFEVVQVVESKRAIDEPIGFWLQLDC